VENPVMAGSVSQRNVAERCINKHRQFGAVITHYDCEDIFTGIVDVASIRIWPRDAIP
jgi:hypothetical protein